MRFEQIQYFVEVARCSSISQAALNLNITQPSVSVAISDLEREIGVRLFDRNKNGTNLRPEAKPYFIEAEKILSAVDGFYSLCGSRDLMPKNLRISTLPSVPSRFKSEIHSNFLANFPKIQLDINMLRAREIIEGVLNWNIDIGILLTYHFPQQLIINDLYNFEKYAILLDNDARFADNINFKPLYCTEMGICMSYELYRKYGDKCSLKDLGNERVLGMSTYKSGLTSYLSNFYELFKEENISIGARDYPTLFELCKRNIGIAMVNKSLYSVYKEYYNDSLFMASITDPMPKLTYTTICHSSNVYRKSFDQYTDLISKSSPEAQG